MQNDNNKSRIGGGILALIIVISIFSGCVAGAGFMHMFTNDSFMLLPELSASVTTSAILTTTNPTQTSFIDPSVTAIPEIKPPTISDDEPIADIYEKLHDTVVTVYNYQNDVPQSGGSGVIFTTDGYVMTNHHVIEDATKVTIVTSDEVELDVVVVGSDARTDIAVLKIVKEGNYHAAALGDSDALRIGQNIVAIGAPLGLSGTVTQGIVSYLNRAVDVDGVRYRMIQTDCLINLGNSGGPLFNLSGEVIGIAARKEIYTLGHSGGDVPVEGIAYAIPVNTAKSIALTLMSEGKVTRGAIGITGQSYVENNQYNGVLVAEVMAGGPAYNAGIKANDVIIKLDDTDVYVFEDLSEALSFKKVGDSVTVTVLRNGKELSFKLTLTVLED